MLRTARCLRIKGTHREVQKRRITELSYKDAIATRNPDVNALVFVADPVGHAPGDLPLRGTTIAIKDNICTKAMPTTCSSLMLRNFSSPFDATVVKYLQEAGASIVGKANCDEFGMGYVIFL